MGRWYLDTRRTDGLLHSTRTRSERYVSMVDLIMNLDLCDRECLWSTPLYFDFLLNTIGRSLLALLLGSYSIPLIGRYIIICMCFSYEIA